MTSLSRSIFRHLRSRKFFFQNTFESQSIIYSRVVRLVRIFYAVSAILSVSTLSWMYPALLKSQFTAPLWPFVFVPPQYLVTICKISFAAWILGSILSAINPFHFVFRFLNASGIFLIVALNNSDGHFGHNWHAYMWTSLIFIFFPRRKIDMSVRRYKFKYAQVFWFSQFAICTFYFMTGLWKVRGILDCAFDPGLTCEMSHKMLTNIAARELIYYRKFAPLSQILFDYPWLGFISYIGTIWLHLISMYFPFRLDTHLIFGILRSVFHLGTLLLFGVDFSPMTFVAVMLFAFSPFQPTAKVTWHQIYRLPPFGWIYERIRIVFKEHKSHQSV